MDGGVGEVGLWGWGWGGGGKVGGVCLFVDVEEDFYMVVGFFEEKELFDVVVDIVVGFVLC